MPSTVTADRPAIVTTAHEVQDFVRSQQRAGKQVGLVPTMGALHAGHLSLVQRSKRESDSTVVSIFVNPLQFGPNEDFSRYPRPFNDDLRLLRTAGVDLVFAPTVEEMYPSGFATHVEVGGLAERLEGAVRPGHFRGVATVVLKLFTIAPADRAYFGQKDYQQTLVVRGMVADFDLPIEVVVCPTVRDADGLALSSRNVFLSADDRRRALALSRCVRLAKRLFDGGQRSATTIAHVMLKELADEPSLAVDYAVVVDASTLADIEQICSPAVALVAARVGTTRLIDNELLTTDKR